MNSWVLSNDFASLENDMDHAHESYKYRTIVLLLVRGSTPLFPCTVQKLDIHSYGVLMSCMWYTKQLLICPYFCSSLAGMLGSSYTPSALRWLDSSSDIGFLLVEGIPTEPLPMYETSVVTLDILSVVIVN